MERLLNLKYINLVNNQIESFPYFLGRLPSLEVILFDQNPYTNVSKEFIAQSPFTLLPALRQYVFDHKDLMIDSSRFGIDGTAKILADIVRNQWG